MLPGIQVKAYVVIAQEWIFTALAGIMVWLRLYVRIKRRMFSASDAVVVLALISLICASICDTLLVALGFEDQTLEITPEGPHSVYSLIPHDRLVSILKIFWASSFPYYTTLWLVKVALILLFYHHLTPEIVAPRLRLYLHCTAGAVGLTYLLIIPLNLFVCMPISTNWEVADPNKACIGYYDNKALMGMFAFGFFGVAVTVSRIIYCVATEGNPIIGISQSWACFEQTVGVIVCCLPAIWTLKLGLRGDKLDVERLYVSREVMEDTLRRNKKDNPHDEVEEAGQEKWWWELRAQRTKDSGQ